MTVWVPRTIPDAIGRRLADLWGIRTDLEWVENVIEAYVKLEATNPVREAIWIAAVVRYCRCFATGIRDRIPQSQIEELDNDLKDLHAYIWELRRMHIAHSVNPYEKNTVAVTVPDPIPDDWAGTPKVTTKNHWRYGLMPADEGAQGLADLARAVRELVEAEVEAEQERVDRAIRDRTADEIAEWPTATIIGGQMPGPSKVSTGRRQAPPRDSVEEG